MKVFITVYRRETKARRGDRKYGRLNEEAERHDSSGVVMMATPCTSSLGAGSGGHKHGGREGHKLCWKFATVS